MQTIITTEGRASRVARKPARRARPASRRTAAKPRSLRARVAAAFRQQAHGVQEKPAYAATVAFYRATGHAWTKALA
jgi:hypothetical protein